MKRYNSVNICWLKQGLTNTNSLIAGIVIPAIFIVSATIANAAVENLNEIMARKVRLATATYSNSLLENSTNYYIWQPETLNYTDVTSNNEVWQLTNSPNNLNETQDISITHWSANGNRLLFHSKRPTAAFTTWNENIWMLANTDGSRMRPAKGAAAQLASMDAYPLWSPILADVLYQGHSNDGQPTAADGFYKVTVSDAAISRSLLLNVPGSTRLLLKKAISGDGRKVMIADTTNAKLQPATVYPEAAITLDTTGGYAERLAFDYFWGQAPTSWSSYHDNFLAGSVNGADGVWNYIMPENTSGSWWRARPTGSGANQEPIINISHTPPYNWGDELEPINSPNSATNPWCPQGIVPGSDCMEYFSHFTPDRWGRFGISTKSNNSPYGTSIADLRKHTYKVKGFTPIQINGVNAQWVQHHDWEAWSDWSVSSAYPNIGNYMNGAIVTQNFNGVNSQKFLASAYTRYNGTASPPYESLARPTQSPDGTKVLYNSTLLNASDSFPQLFWTVAYYPYPPEIKSASKSGSNISLTWDFNQGSSGTPNLATTRTYATRGWPHETNDRPPSPREIDKFRVWVSTDNVNWTPAGTTFYNNCRATNECGTWTESSWTYDYAQPNSSTRYYAITSLEYSGLESRTLSNIWKVITDAAGKVTSQVQHGAYPINPGGKSSFYTASTMAPRNVMYSYKEPPAVANGQYTIRWNEPTTASLVRYYNIYAKDGFLPFTNNDPLSVRQLSRIASIPASSDYTGSGSFKYIDWLGATDGSTKYIVTAVDYQGNETVDVEPPIVTLSSVTSPTLITSQTLTGTVSDNPSGTSVSIKVNSDPAVAATVSENNWTCTVTNLVVGSNTITVSATDAAGNSTTLPTVTITVSAATSTTTVAAASGGGGGGCFIATAAYGSYLHPKVQILRDFRDNYLLTNSIGCSLVAMYYHFSPPIAECITKHEPLRLLMRLLLTPIVMMVAKPEITLLMVLFISACWIIRRRLNRRVPAWHVSTG